ncbi:hypothetical protein BIY37_02290 [Candidatus Brocadia sapporoensis]|uniref:Uncharacterized protein n=1 Tax=Candidatus Brocadia sapporoensis TaxID=392547 RepID=A0A1V6M2J1_9BACT|nr:hypothetical protein BIY37_02290 [Candidatus Brocadia sapporoensis]
MFFTYKSNHPIVIHFNGFVLFRYHCCQEAVPGIIYLFNRQIVQVNEFKRIQEIPWIYLLIQ